MNSDDNIGFIDDQALIHFVTSYSPYFAEAHATIDLKNFAPLAIAGNVKRDAEGHAADRIMAYRTKAELWGKERTAVEMLAMPWRAHCLSGAQALFQSRVDILSR